MSSRRIDDGVTVVSRIPVEFGEIRVAVLDEDRNLIGLVMEDLYTVARKWAAVHTPDRVKLVGGTGPFCGYCMGAGLPLLGLTPGDVTQTPDTDHMGNWICYIKISDLTEESCQAAFLNYRP